MSSPTTPEKEESIASKTLDSTSKPGNGFPLHPQLAAVVTVLVVAFYKPLLLWIGLATSSDLYSHTLLIPVVVLYLIWDNHGKTPSSSPNRINAVTPAIIAVYALFRYLNTPDSSPGTEAVETETAYALTALVGLIVTASCLFVGRATIRQNIFPIVLLFFTAPFTVEMKVAIQTFFQHTSADAAYWLIKTSGIPIFRTDLIFEMPNIDMEVAPQCSGIRSTLVLFITSLVGSYLFLKTTWKRSLAVFLVIPLGILRNGIRILILAQLCHRYGAQEIDGWFHKQGGQPLFVATLIPFFIILYFLWKSEPSDKKETVPQSQAS